MAAPIFGVAAKKIALSQAQNSKTVQKVVLVILITPFALFGGLIFMLFGAAALVTNAYDTSTLCNDEQCKVSQNDQVNAQILVEAVAEGAIKTWPTEIFEKQIQPIASGVASRDCEIDSRLLQILVLTYQKFGSMTISDINRPCIGSSLNCPMSPHCKIPASAIDFALVGNEVVTGGNKKSIEVLDFFHTFLPAGTMIGQINCRSGSASWPKFTQFNDSCDHIHIDLRATSEGLDETFIDQFPTPSPSPTLPSVQVFLPFGKEFS